MHHALWVAVMAAPSVNATPAANAAAGKGKYSGFGRIALVPRDCKFGRARLRGWNDYRDSKPFRPTYDTWSRKKQFAYERGRFQAALTLAARPGVRLPLWRLDELVDDLIRRHIGDWSVAGRIINETRVARARVKSEGV